MSLPLYHDTFDCTGPSCEGEWVLIHGWGMNSHVWDAVMPDLLTRFRVMRIDLPGMGRSPLPGVAFEEQALVSRLLATAPEHALWMGWSLGGALAAQVASAAPARVQALVTVATNPRFVATPDWPHAMQVGMLADFQALLEEDSEGTLIRFLSLQCRGSESMRDDLRYLRERIFHDGLPAHRALREGLEMLARRDLRACYRGLGMPHLVVCGQHDPLMPAAAIPDIEALNPGIRTALIGGAAHLPFVSHPDLFLRALEDFLDSL